MWVNSNARTGKTMRSRHKKNLSVWPPFSALGCYRAIYLKYFVVSRLKFCMIEDIVVSCCFVVCSLNCFISIRHRQNQGKKYINIHWQIDKQAKSETGETKNKHLDQGRKRKNWSGGGGMLTILSGLLFFVSFFLLFGREWSFHWLVLVVLVSMGGNCSERGVVGGQGGGLLVLWSPCQTAGRERERRGEQR